MKLGPDEEFCEGCGQPVKKQAQICPNCGINTSQGVQSARQTEFCNSCGEEIIADAEMCPNCGVSQGRSYGISGGGNNADSVVYYLQLIAGSIVLLTALSMFGNGAAIGALITAIFGLLLFPQIREELNLHKEYPITAFGWQKSVTRKPIRTGTCTICSSDISEGHMKTYSDEFTIAGFRVYSKTKGQNHYCNTCSEGDNVQQVSTGKTPDKELEELLEE